MAEYTHIVQPFEPVVDSDSEILILGSLPSVKSREQGFYYGHPQNRFWKVISAVLGCDTPVTVEEKRKMLIKHHIALWDVIHECDIIGSSDASIKNVIPADICRLMDLSKIASIYVNGKTAEKYYKKYLEPLTGIKAVVLPSSSPANAAYSLESLVRIWKEELMERKGNYIYQVEVNYADYLNILADGHMAESDDEDVETVWNAIAGKNQSFKQDIKVWYTIGENEFETVVMSLGEAYDALIEKYEAEDMLLRAYMMECFAMGVLRLAYDAFDDENYKKTGKHHSDFAFFDEEQMKMGPELLRKLHTEEIKINEAYAMIPQKTVVFETKLQEYKKANCINICEKCNNIHCPNRKKKTNYNYGYQRIFS